MTVQTGLQRLHQSEFAALRGQRVGVVANPTAVDAALRGIVPLLLAASVDLRVVFGPEHGFLGAAQDMISVDSSPTNKGFRLVSLYGQDADSLTPKDEDLADIDVLVFDIQDVGARYYTYIWTLAFCLRACARCGVSVLVLDRPNPIGGQAVEGVPVDVGYTSFVGLKNIPNRHGLTVGEVATWVCQDEKLDVDMQVVTMQGWQRKDYYEQTGLVWIPPSPNMPTVDVALVYPGMCLVEGTELSEGRGTTTPFSFSGAPFVDGERLAVLLTRLALPGVVFRPVVFSPTFHKFCRTECEGVQPHVIDRTKFSSFRTGLAMIWAIHRLWPDSFAWREKAYEFVDTVPAIDLLYGSAEFRNKVNSGSDWKQVDPQGHPFAQEFQRMRQDWLLYRG